MVVPPRLVPLPLLVLAIAAVPAGTATAAASKKQAKSVKGYTVPCLKADGTTVQYSAKPKSCIVAEDLTLERSLVAVSRLSWNTWTASRATASGRVNGDGYSGKVGIVATKPKRCSATRVIFTNVKVTIRLHGETGSLAETNFACPK